MADPGKRRHFYKVWFKMLDSFVDEGVRKLTRSELAVHLILIRDTRPDGTARAGLTDLATRGGMSKRSASRAVQDLIERGVLHIVKPGVSGKATLYTLLPLDDLRHLNPTAANWAEGRQEVNTDATVE